MNTSFLNMRIPAKNLANYNNSSFVEEWKEAESGLCSSSPSHLSPIGVEILHTINGHASKQLPMHDLVVKAKIIPCTTYVSHNI